MTTTVPPQPELRAHQRVSDRSMIEPRTASLQVTPKFHIRVPQARLAPHVIGSGSESSALPLIRS